MRLDFSKRSPLLRSGYSIRSILQRDGRIYRQRDVKIYRIYFLLCVEISFFNARKSSDPTIIYWYFLQPMMVCYSCNLS